MERAVFAWQGDLRACADNENKSELEKSKRIKRRFMEIFRVTSDGKIYFFVGELRLRGN